MSRISCKDTDADTICQHLSDHSYRDDTLLSATCLNNFEFLYLLEFHTLISLLERLVSSVILCGVVILGMSGCLNLQRQIALRREWPKKILYLAKSCSLEWSSLPCLVGVRCFRVLYLPLFQVSLNIDKNYTKHTLHTISFYTKDREHTVVYFLK